jgi:PHP family Zn ribbon phosphoesterase
VLNRIESLSVNAELSRLDDDGLVRGPVSRPPFRRLVPLRDLVAAVEGVGKNTKTVGRAVDRLIESCGSELNVLINTASRELQTATTDEIATAIVSVRQGDLEIEPGYDGVYGVVSPITD